MSTRARQPRGVPIGGEFANEHRAPGGVDLTLAPPEPPGAYDAVSDYGAALRATTWARLLDRMVHDLDADGVQSWYASLDEAPRILGGTDGGVNEPSGAASIVRAGASHGLRLAIEAEQVARGRMLDAVTAMVEAGHTRDTIIALVRHAGGDDATTSDLLEVRARAILDANLTSARGA